MKNNFIKTIIQFSLSSWITLIISLVSTMITTRIVSPDIYGMVSLFNTSITTLMYFTSLGLDGAFIRFYHEPPNEEKVETFTFKLFTITILSNFIFFSFIFIFYYRQFSLFFIGKISLMIYVCVMVSTIANISLRYFNIKYRMNYQVKNYTIQNIAIQIVTRFSIIFAAIISSEYEYIVIISTISILILAIVFLYIQKENMFGRINVHCNNFNLKGYSTVFKYALFNCPVYVLTNINVLVPKNYIIALLGTASLGVYSSASYFQTIFSAAITGFSTFWSAYVYENYKTDKTRITGIVNFLLVVCIFLFSCFSLGRNIVYLLIGGDYQGSKIFFSLLLIGPILDAVSQGTVYGIDIEKKNYIYVLSLIFMIITNLILCIILIPKYGLLGAAFANSISCILKFTVNTYIAQRLYKTIMNTKQFVIGLSLLLMISIITIFQNYISYIMVMIILVLSFYIFKEEINVILNKGKMLLIRQSK